MCGRFVRHTAARELTKIVGALDAPDEPGPSYNIAPTQDVLNASVHDGRRVMTLLRWGLVPRWSKDPSKIHPINARAETAATNGVFRVAFRTGRTLVPADGFYEWKKTESGKVPYYITRRDGQPMWFAGLSDRWEREGERLETCAIITTEANDAVRPLHNRMPVILPESAWDAWLDPDNDDRATIQACLQPCDPDLIETRPVSRRVNSPRNNDPALLEPT